MWRTCDGAAGIGQTERARSVIQSQGVRVSVRVRVQFAGVTN